MIKFLEKSLSDNRLHCQQHFYAGAILKLQIDLVFILTNHRLASRFHTIQDGVK